MDGSNWRAAQGQAQIPGQVMGGEAVTNLGMEGGDWRTQLQPITKFIQSNGASNIRNPQYPVFSQVKMESSNWRAAPGQAQIPGQVMGGEAVANLGMEGSDWRTQLQPEPWQRIVNKIMETLKIHLLFSGPEGLLEIKKIAVRFEHKIYTQATSQKDYLRKITMQMLTVMSRSRNPVANFPV